MYYRLVNSSGNNASPRVGLHRRHGLLASSRTSVVGQGLLQSRTEPGISGGEIEEILRVVSHDTSVNLSYLQPGPVRERILRRMALGAVATLGEYLEHLNQHPPEVHQLFRELVTNQSGFFQEPATLDALRDGAPGTLWKEIPSNKVFRAWIPCCSSG